MLTDNQERQENELAALESIFDDERLFVRSTDGFGGQLSVNVVLPNNFFVKYPSLNDIVNDEKLPHAEEKEEHMILDIQHLPPITLHFDLPDNYPSEGIPNYTLSCKWLTVLDLTKLCRKLDGLWNEQRDCEILYEWVQTLTDNTFSILGIASELLLAVTKLNNRRISLEVDKRAIQDISSMECLITSLIEYNSFEVKRLFESSYFNCGVCFDEKPGSLCVQFPQCKHTYCLKCMTDYFTIQIQDGAVKALTCPENKCDIQADPSMVKRLVTDDIFIKYDKLLLQRTLECMTDISYCPRKTCQSPVLKEPERNMGRCPNCRFVFCFLCHTTYHGAARCPISNKEMVKLRETYLNATEEERNELEKKYGKTAFRKMISDGYSEAWIEKYSKQCPACKVHIQKIDGCNKMTCYKCCRNFCWLCLTILQHGKPYDHFSNTNTACFNKLFEGMNVDFDDNSDDEDGWVNFVI